MIRQPKKTDIVPESGQAGMDQTGTGWNEYGTDSRHQAAVNADNHAASRSLASAKSGNTALQSQSSAARIASARTSAARTASARTSAAGSAMGARSKQRLLAGNRISLLMSLLFLGFMFVLAILLLIVPGSSASGTGQGARGSWPAFTIDHFFSGEYTRGITSFYDDAVSDKETLKSAGRSIRSAFGIGTGNNTGTAGSATASATAGNGTASGTADSSRSVSRTDEKSSESSNSSFTGEIQSRNYHSQNVETINENGIILALQDGHWRAMSLYDYSYNSLYNDTVNYVRQVLDEDINIYFMPLPTAVQFYCPPDYTKSNADMEAAFNQLSSKMVSGVTCIDVISALNDHNAQNIYLRTDNHMAALGAYYAARHFTENANVPFADISTYTRYVNEGFSGNMYDRTENENLLNDPEDFEYFVPTSSYTADYYGSAFNYSYTSGLFFEYDVEDSYLTFLGGDDMIIKITTDAGNSRRLLLVKDSHANAMVPFLTSSFKEIFVVDQRYFDLNLINFVNNNHITDVLFANSYEGLFDTAAEQLEYIVYSNYDVEVADGAPEAVLPSRHQNDSADDADDESGETEESGEADAAAQYDRAFDLAYEALNQSGWDLYNAFTYAQSRNYDPYIYSETTSEAAVKGFETQTVDCVGAASIFCYMARAMGYECWVVYGAMPLTDGSYGEHAWVEIVVDGETLVCDPAGGQYGYMFYYGKPGTLQYIRDHVMPDV